MDEYQLEIQSLRRTLARLREEEADPALIEEYETEYRNLSSLYRAATDTFDADRNEPRLPDALASLGFGDWTLTNVYSFVYDASMELPVDDGRELARRIRRDGLRRFVAGGARRGGLTFRDFLAWVEHPVRIKRGLDPAHQGHRPWAELPLDVLHLGGADAVLAGERSTHVQNRLEQFARCSVGTGTFPLDAWIDEESCVDIAIAEMAEVHDRKLVLDAELVRVRYQLGHPVARDHNIFVHLADLHRRNRSADRLARRPEALGLAWLGRPLEL